MVDVQVKVKITLDFAIIVFNSIVNFVCIINSDWEIFSINILYKVSLTLDCKKERGSVLTY
jgi:hypothetical protein